MCYAKNYTNMLNKADNSVQEREGERSKSVNYILDTI